VLAALRAGIEVTVLPGPSAVETALVASGFAGERYAFVGFLPRRAAERHALWHELRTWRWPAVAFESPRRLAASLRSLADAEPERELAVCRELTKRFEEVARGTAAELAGRFAGQVRGEVTLVIAPSAETPAEVGSDDARASVAELVAAGTPRRVAAEVVARLTGRSRNELYRDTL
jgi:16S rRNA (cytidine1402-2'-O)-methyltransferase